MNESRGVERLTGLFLGQPLGGQLSQFVVDARQQLFRGLRIALVEGGQNACDFVHGLSLGIREGRVLLTGETSSLALGRRWKVERELPSFVKTNSPCPPHSAKAHPSKKNAWQFLQDDLVPAFIQIGAVPCRVGGDENAGECPEGMIGGQGLFFENVEAGTGDFACPQRFDQVI